MISNKNFQPALALAALLAFTGAAQATIAVYTTQASFLAAVGSAGTDTFDDLSYVARSPSPLARTAGSHSYTAEAGPTSDFYPAASLDGSDVFLAPTARADTLYASGFSAGVNAVGGFFFGTDLNGAATPAALLTVSVTDSSGTFTQSLLNPGAPNTTFRGFVSTGGLSLLTVWVGAAQGVGEVDVWPAVNNLTLAVAVPEPQSYALMLGGLALLGWAARRQKQG